MRKYALIIGNCKYDDPSFQQLVAPGADAREFARVLASPELGSFDVVDIVLDDVADNIRRKIIYLLQGKQSDDLLLLYFSGHGQIDSDTNGELFLVARDTRKECIRANSIPAYFIKNELEASASRRKIMILDSCYSGAFCRGAKASEPMTITQNTFESNGYGYVVLTASDATQYAWEGDRTNDLELSYNSVFTHYLIEGIETGKADKDGDGQINLEELYEYVIKQMGDKKQKPRKWNYNQEGALYISQNPNPTAELPFDLQYQLQSLLPDMRRDAVGKLKTLLFGSNRGLALAAKRTLESLVENEDSMKVRTAASKCLETFTKSKQDKLEQSIKLEQSTKLEQNGNTQTTQRNEDIGKQVDKGNSLLSAGKFEQAIAVYEEIERRFGAATEHEILVEVATALRNKGQAFYETGERQKALEAFAKSKQELEESRNTQTTQRNEDIGKQVDKGNSLLSAGKFEQAITVYEEIEKRFSAATEREIKLQVVMALRNKGLAFYETGERQKAVATLEEIERRFALAKEPEILEQVTLAKLSKNKIIWPYMVLK